MAVELKRGLHAVVAKSLAHGLDVNDLDLVFCRPGGSPEDPNVVGRRFGRRIRDLARLPAIGLHGLRHTHATLLLEEGAAPHARCGGDVVERKPLVRLVDRTIVALVSAAIGVGVGGGIPVVTGFTLPQILGYAGLIVATILGLRVLVAITRDRVV